MMQPINQTLPAQGGFIGKLGDTFLDGVGKYMDYRAAEKVAELNGNAGLANRYAIEKNNQVNELDDRQRQSESSQWINGVDNSVVVLGGAGAIALLLILTR